MHTFFDSSAFAKRYLKESGTEELLSVLSKASQVVLSSLCHTELLSAFNRVRREKRINTAQYKQLRTNLEQDLQHAAVLHVSTQVLEQAAELLEQYPLRALDSLQVASAVVSRSSLFVSSDGQQCRAAKAAGLKTRQI